MNELDVALAELGRGGVVAAATESVFGLLADATRRSAIDRLLGLKSRQDKGIPLILPARDAWLDFVEAIASSAARLADAFWPGPLTIALPARAGLDSRLTELGLIAVRLPGDCPAAELARRFGKALSATSANRSGEPPSSRADQVRAVFSEAVKHGELLVIGPDAPGGPPSTVVAVREGRMGIVRPGALSRAEIERALGGPLQSPSHG